MVNYVSKIFGDMFKGISRTESDIADMAYKVKTGKMKRSELEIAAKGGRGISRYQKYKAKRAKRKLGL